MFVCGCGCLPAPFSDSRCQYSIMCGVQATTCEAGLRHTPFLCIAFSFSVWYMPNLPIKGGRTCQSHNANINFSSALVLLAYPDCMFNSLLHSGPLSKDFTLSLSMSSCVYHHVTIQRLLSLHDSEPKINSPRIHRPGMTIKLRAQ